MRTMRIRIFLASMETPYTHKWVDVWKRRKIKFQFRSLFMRQMILFQLAAVTAPDV